MEIKGTAVKTTDSFMKEKYPELYLEWKKNLPEESKEFFRNIIQATKWYPLYDAVILPTETVAKVLGKSKEEAATELGVYSAEVALNGVYKIFIRISNPDFVISRATQVFATYYNPGSIEITEKNEYSIKAVLKDFQKQDALIMYRISGWMQGTLKATRRKEIDTEIKITELGGDLIYCDMIARWT
jgi:hypothetical protein